MLPKIIKSYSNASTIAFLLGIFNIIGVLVFDKNSLQTGVLSEGWPDFTPKYIIRSLIIFSSLAAIIWSITDGQQKIKLVNSQGWATERWIVVLMVIVSMLILFMFLFSTSYFSAFSMEDSIIEWGSFIFLIFSCILFFITFLCAIKKPQVLKPTKWLLLAPVLVFFVTGMEEVSWLQRVFEVETPAILTKNLQNEINLHNFATNKVENAYYFSGFLLLVVAPYLRSIFPNLMRDERFELFVPRSYVVLVGAIACAYNFDMWNILFTQISFYGAVIILFSYLLIVADKKDKFIAGIVLFLIIFSQVCFLVNGHSFKRSWEITEYKELLIPMAYFVYSLDVYFSIRNNKFKKEESAFG